MSQEVKPNNYDFRGKLSGEHDTAILTMLYLILLMYAEHWRKLAWATFLGNFLVFLVQQFCGALMNSYLLEYATVFPIKNKFKPVILTFYFDLVSPWYFLK